MKTKHSHGMTLVEVIIAMTLSVLMLGAVMSTFLFVARSAVRITSYFDMEREATRGLELLGRELRMAQAVSSTGNPTITQITLTVPTAVGTGSNTVVYSYNSGPHTLTRESGGNTEILIRDIEPGTFAFRRFDLNQDPSYTDYDTKQLQITMTIKPPLGGLVAATSKRVVSSRFVLRNR